MRSCHLLALISPLFLCVWPFVPLRAPPAGPASTTLVHHPDRGDVTPIGVMTRSVSWAGPGRGPLRARTLSICFLLPLTQFTTSASCTGFAKCLCTQLITITPCIMPHQVFHATSSFSLQKFKFCKEYDFWTRTSERHVLMVWMTTCCWVCFTSAVMATPCHWVAFYFGWHTLATIPYTWRMPSTVKLQFW